MAICRETAISRLKSGETLILTLPKGNCASDGARAQLSGGGRVTTATYRWLTNSPRVTLRPVSPGLFPGAEPQEWVWPDG